MCKCDYIFNDFKWKELVTLTQEELSSNTGVYAIRISKRGKPVDWIIPRTDELLEKLNWFAFGKHVLSRVHRLKRITECSIIYIGAAPTSLQSRYKDLCGRRHTAFYAIIALLLADWKLDFGWKEDNKPLEKEKQLKNLYLNLHGRLPAVVER